MHAESRLYKFTNCITTILLLSVFQSFFWLQLECKENETKIETGECLCNEWKCDNHSSRNETTEFEACAQDKEEIEWFIVINSYSSARCKFGQSCESNVCQCEEEKEESPKTKLNSVILGVLVGLSVLFLLCCMIGMIYMTSKCQETANRTIQNKAQIQVEVTTESD